MPKNNEKFWRLARIAVTIGILLLAAVYAYGRLNNRVETLEGQAKEAQKTKEMVIRIEAHVEYIKESIDEIKEQLK